MTTPIGFVLTLDGERNVTDGMRRVGASITAVDGAVAKLDGAFRGLAGAAVGAVSLREFVQAADAVTSLNNKLTLATGSAQAAAAAYSQLFDVAQRSRVGFIELGNTYASISTAAADMGVSQGRLLKVTEAIGNAVTVSGSSAQAAQAALMQLGQGLASGTLRGEELNSVMEQTPRLAKAIADGMGIARGELRALGAQGAITAQQVIKALESQSDVLKSEVQGSVLTVGQAFTQLKNATTMAVGEFDKASGASQALAGAISTISEAIGGLGKTVAEHEDAFKLIGGGLVGAGAIAALVGVGAGIAKIGGAVATLGAILAANPYVLALLGFGAVAAGGLGVAAAYSKTEAGMRETVATLQSQNERSEEMRQRALASGRVAGAENIRLEMEKRRDQILKLQAEIDGNAAGTVGGGRGIVNRPTVAAMELEAEARRSEISKYLTDNSRQTQGQIREEEIAKARKRNAELVAKAEGDTNTVLRLQAALKVEIANIEARYKDKGGGASSKLATEFDNLSQSLAQKIKLGELEAATSGKVSESEKLRVKYALDLQGALKGLSVAERASIEAQLDALANQEKARQQEKTELQLIQQRADLRNAEADAIAAQTKAQDEAAKKSLQSAQDRVSSLEEEERAATLAALQNVTLAEAVEMVAIARLREEQTRYNDIEGGRYREIEREIEARQKLLGVIGSKAAREANAKAAEDAAQDWQRTAETIGSTLQDYIMGGGKNAAEYLKRLFSTLVLQPVVRSLVGGAMGVLGLAAPAAANGAGGALGTALNAASLASNAYSLYSGGLGGTALGQLYAGYTGATLAPGMVGPSATPITMWSQLGNGAGGAGMSGIAGGAAAAAVAAVVLNALGAFRSERRTDYGLSGTLGGTISPFETWREGGTLFSGPSYSQMNPIAELESARKRLADLQGMGEGRNPQMIAIQQMLVDQLESTYGKLAETTDAQARALNTAFDKMRTGVGSMADVLGLSSDAVRDFTTALGEGGKGLSFEGLNDQQIAEKINEALATANNDLAQQVIGTWETLTSDITRTLVENVGSAGEDMALVYTEVTDSITKTRYVASEYAKDGEKAIDTLTRLSTSMQTVNNMADALGYGFQDASLSAANAASTIADAFGGLEAFAQSMGAYFQNYYSDAEQKAAAARQVARALGNVGIDIDPAAIQNATRPAIRAFVEGVGAQFGFESEQYVAAIQQANVLAGFTEALPSALSASKSAADEAARAAEEARKKWQDITDGLLSDRDQLAIDLLRAQGREEAALAAERVLAIKGMDAYQAALWDANTATRAQIADLEKLNTLRDEERGLQVQLLQARGDFAGAMELITQGMGSAERAAYLYNDALRKQIETTQAIANELPGVLDKYRTPEQRLAVGYGSVAADLGRAGIGISAEALAAATKDQIAAAAAAVYNLGSTSDEARLALIRAASTLADLKDQALGLAQSTTDAAYSALEREVNARKVLMQETLADVRSVFDAVGDAARSLYMEVSSTSAMLGAQGRAFIDNALVNARLTGYLPDPKDLQQAISAATGDLGKQVYATQFEADRDRLLLAGKLSALEGISGDQLTEQEKQLKSLDGILDTARSQIDALRGIDTRVLGVDTRIGMLADAINAERVARSAVKTGGGGGGGAGGASGQLLPGWANWGKGDWVVNAGGSLVADAASGTIYSQGGQNLYRSSLVDAATALIEAGQSMDVYDAIKQSGFTLAQADKVLGLTSGTAEDWAKAMGLPVFHEGTPFVPRTGLALLEQGEAVFPRAFNPFTQAAGAGNAEVVEELRALRASNEALREDSRRQAGELIRLQGQMARMLQQWDGDGLPPERKEVTA